MSVHRDRVTKIIIVGKQGTGKTSIIKRYTWNKFDQFEQPTLGVTNSLKQLQYTMKRQLNLAIWDIAGQDRYKSVTKSFIRNSMGCIIVCDTQEQNSLDEALAWKKIIQAESEQSSDIPIILAQNKYDLISPTLKQCESSNLFGSKEFLNTFAEQHNFNSCIQVSALDGHNIDELFKLLADHIIKLQSDNHLSASNQTDNSISLSYYESQITKITQHSKIKQNSCC